MFPAHDDDSGVDGSQKSSHDVFYVLEGVSLEDIKENLL